MSWAGLRDGHFSIKDIANSLKNQRRFIANLLTLSHRQLPSRSHNPIICVVMEFTLKNPNSNEYSQMTVKLADVLMGREPVAGPTWH
jgi:hypothetical protein